MRRSTLIGLAALLASTTAEAQTAQQLYDNILRGSPTMPQEPPQYPPQRGYVARQPSGPPTFVDPTPNGGYVARQPGGPPTFVDPTPNGGYVIRRPGGAPTFVDPR